MALGKSLSAWRSQCLAPPFTCLCPWACHVLSLGSCHIPGKAKMSQPRDDNVQGGEAVLVNSFPVFLPPGCEAESPGLLTWLHQRAAHMLYLEVAGRHRGG